MNDNQRKEIPKNGDSLGLPRVYSIFFILCIGLWLVFPVADAAMKDSATPIQAIIIVLKSTRGLVGVLLLIVPVVFSSIPKRIVRKWFNRFYL
jgi:small-conductance mechanosensitive channel